MKTASAGWGSILAVCLLLCCAGSSAAADLFSLGSPAFPPPRFSSSLGASSPSGLFRAQLIGVTFPSPTGFTSITYYVTDWNITLSDNLCLHSIQTTAVNSTNYILPLNLLTINHTCGFTRNQQVTFAGDNSASTVYQASGPWGQGANLAVGFNQRIQGIWPFSQHYTDSTLQYIDQLTVAFQGSQAFGSLGNTIAFSCVGSCTPPVLP